MADGVEIKKDIEGLINLSKALEFVKNNSVYVGITDDTNDREEEDGVKKPVTNAELLFIHTNGSYPNHIPKRPVIEPAIKDDANTLGKMMNEAFTLILKGDKEAAIKKLKTAGMRGQNVSRGWFTNPKNGWPPNSPSTIRAKKRKHKKKGYEPRPLIDTDELRKSITYFVETKGGRIK